MAGFEEMELKWQNRWLDAGLDRSERDGRPKFMIIFAYPGVTGYLHVGHMRGYTYADAIGRFKRMTGHDVLFPVGTHATGNGAISLSQKVASKDERTLDYLIRNGCPPERLADLEDPAGAVEFFNQVYVNDYWRRFGFLADWRRFTCTIYPDYNRFIDWQFRKLMQAGLLIQKPYFAPACLRCGPVAVDASETDLSQGGNAENQEYTLLKFRCGDLFLVAATLRPETVFGQVNFWVNPDVTYVKIRKGDETWIVSRSAAEKMSLQKDGIEVMGEIAGKDMVGWMCEAPMIKRLIPVFPARFCNPDVGTGLVTSVPSDAPDDYVALLDVKNDPDLCRCYNLDPAIVRAVVPIPIIDIEGYGELPAKDVLERMGIKGSGDPRLPEAKKQVYKDGYHIGRMNSICGEYAGMRVEEAKDIMRAAMLESGDAELFYDLSETVICRCGSPVHIRRVDDQWFINYADETLTTRTSEHCRGMDIYPQEYANNVHGVLDWFRERACVRQGNWLGTRFPFDEKWIIEAISDSTLYPIYYLVSLYANDGRLKPEQMTEAFFDHVILGIGERDSVSEQTGVSSDLLACIAEDVAYWYPLDLNLGGKEHMTVHFPAFLFNHTAVLPADKWPRGILVNWYITSKTGKISKSKGGAQPIPGAAGKFGVDSLRLYYAHIASPFTDVEWDEDAVNSYRMRVERVMKMVEELLEVAKGTEVRSIDRWMMSRVDAHVRSCLQFMESFDLRQMASVVYFDMVNDLRWYLRRGGDNAEVVKDTLHRWVRMMVPVTPHAAEEMWQMIGGRGLASASDYPVPDDGRRSTASEAGEALLRDLMDDVKEIVRVTGMDAKKVVVYTSPEWKNRVLSQAVSLALDSALDIPTLTKWAMADASIRSNGKAVPDFIKKLASDLQRRSRNDLESMSVPLPEKEHLQEAGSFLTAELGAEVLVLQADEPDLYDPQGKARFAVPGRPALFIE
ncbi:MAG: leucine--tRNA ligase [Candidatus Methanomethylophilaceae archaeon]